MRPNSRLIHKGGARKKALLFDPVREEVTVVFDITQNADGTGCASYEMTADASAWESVCFYASNLTLLTLFVSFFSGIIVGFVAVLVGGGTFGGAGTAFLTGLVVLTLGARNPSSLK